ncbi:MAG: energy transducer TonB [Candidatus Eisenbacteria bacterium]|nr:energy transducer TonB [Candidatus Eisenbacteria bacterium]
MREGPSPARLARAARERVYRRTLRLAACLAIAGHAALFLSLTPPHRIPLVRHLGYEGPLRILPEISEMREPGPVESERESVSGRGASGAFRAIDIAIVDSERPVGERVREDVGARDETVGDENLTQLEQTLPQPTSRELVVLKLVKPEYPRSSVLDGVEGVVTFRVHVTRDGTVARVWRMSSEVDRACDEAARRALLQWRFRPFLSEGTPTDVLVDQRIRFILTGAEAVTGATRGQAGAARGRALP